MVDFPEDALPIMGKASKIMFPVRVVEGVEHANFFANGVTVAGVDGKDSVRDEMLTVRRKVLPESIVQLTNLRGVYPSASTGVCKRQGENVERGIIGGDPPLRGGGRLCRESPILFLSLADGAGP